MANSGYKGKYLETQNIYCKYNIFFLLSTHYFLVTSIHTYANDTCMATGSKKFPPAERKCTSTPVRKNVIIHCTIGETEILRMANILPTFMHLFAELWSRPIFSGSDSSKIKRLRLLVNCKAENYEFVTTKKYFLPWYKITEFTCSTLGTSGHRGRLL